MVQLINKGGFRERANRSRKYQQSENEITTLNPPQYQPNPKEIDSPPNSQQEQNNQPKNQA